MEFIFTHLCRHLWVLLALGLLFSCKDEPANPNQNWANLLEGRWQVQRYHTEIELANFNNIETIEEGEMLFTLQGTSGGTYTFFQEEIGVENVWQFQAQNGEQIPKIYLEGALLDEGIALQIGRNNRKTTETFQIKTLTENLMELENRAVFIFPSGGVNLQMVIEIKILLNK
ncbi:hypothetical protein [Hugenholtzia roseola]|uniref:hypothetical protein n=1 Tax=Hugenholtzia roseola TaxID=1002 RepID=UPI00047C8B58|nr:hypothetical protein [Hugenholtzia roseola]